MNSVAEHLAFETLERTTVPTRVATFVVSAMVFVVTAALRYLALVRFTNDEYISLTPAQQMLFGEWPSRDFLDPGMPLAYVASAVAQLMFGRTLFAEAVLTAAALGLAAAFTVVAARRLSGSLLVGVVAAAFEVAIFPRGYAYPKVLLYAAAPLVIWWYLNQPSLRRMVAVAAFAQIAFLFRHDHGVFIGAGTAVAAALTNDGIRSARLLIRQGALFAAASLVVAAPYLLYLSANGGAVHHFVQGVRFSAAEAAENGYFVPSFGPALSVLHNSEAYLFFLFYAVPVVAAAVLVVSWRRVGDPATLPFIAPLIVIALLADRAFLRHELATRLADAVVPVVLLASWLVGQIHSAKSRGARLLLRTGAATLAALTALPVITVGDTVEQLDRASLFGGLRRMPERFAERTTALLDRYNEREMPPGASRVLIPFFQYIDRCTDPDQRLLVPGFLPEVPFHAGRPFAAARSTILPGYLDAPDEDRELVAKIERQDVPFMIVSSQSKGAVWGAYPVLASFIDTHFEPLVSYPAGDNVVIEVGVNRLIPRRGIDQETGWPCFK